MKKSILNICMLIFLIGVSLSFVSCGSDDNQEEPVTAFSVEGLQGTWQAISAVTTGCEYEDDNGTETFNCPDFCQTISFEGNTYTRTYTYSSSWETTGTFTISGDAITFCPNSGNDGCSEGSTGRIEEGQLILVFVDSDCTDTYTFEKG